MKESYKCHKCEQDYEKLYLVPYLTDQFINVVICRECSMLLHQKIYDFVSHYLQNGKIKHPLDENIIIDACKSQWGGTARCITSDGRNVNMAEELNRLEIEKMEKEDIRDFHKHEYKIKCDCCELEHTALTQKDDHAEYTTTVYFQCQCGNFLEFQFPVN